MDALATQWLPEVRAFFEFWESLRTGQLVPTTEYFLDRVPCDFVPNCYIAEVGPGGAVVRYQGTLLSDYWQRDFTGREIHDGTRGDFKAGSLDNMKTVLERPCGLFARFSCDTSGGEQAVSEYINLPLACQSGRPPRIVCFLMPDSGWERFLPMKRSIARAALSWIDIGAGKPSGMPYDFR